MKATSRKAILYVLRELGRRAGAASDWIARWRVRFESSRVVLFPQQDCAARVIFPFDASKPARFQQLREAPPSCYTWMDAPETALVEAVPNFIVFFEENTGVQGPLFANTSGDTVECRGDILTSSLWTLACLEESLGAAYDAHGRFPASASVAFRCNCLDRPVVDEYALALRQAISRVLPGWTPEPPQISLKLSHDIDLVGLPRQLRSTAAHLYPRRIPQAFFRDILLLLDLGLPAYLNAVLETARMFPTGRL